MTGRGTDTPSERRVRVGLWIDDDAPEIDPNDICPQCSMLHYRDDEPGADDERWEQFVCGHTAAANARRASGFVRVLVPMWQSISPLWPPEHVTRGGWYLSRDNPSLNRRYRSEVRSPIDGIHAQDVLHAIQLEHSRRPRESMRSVAREILAMDAAAIMGLLRTTVRLPCGSTSHTLEWSGGTDLLIGPPDDPAEHVLNVLRGDKACDRVAAAWASNDASWERSGRLPDELRVAFDAAYRAAEAAS